MLLTILAASGVIFVFFFILRFRIRMAALVAWIVGTLTASINKEVKPVVDDKPQPKSPTRRKNKNTNSKQSKNKKSKPAAEPVELQVETSDRETSPATKYQAVVQETRRRSLDFDALVNKLGKIQEKTEEIVVERKRVVEKKLVVENKIVVPEIYVTESQIRENSTQDLKESASSSDIQKTQGRGKKKRSPKPEKIENKQAEPTQEIVVTKKITVSTKLERSKDLGQAQGEQTKKEKKEVVVDKKEITSIKLKGNKNLEQSQQQDRVKREEEVVVDKRKPAASTEVAGSKDLRQSPPTETKKEKKEITSFKVTDLEQTQQDRVNKGKRGVVVDKNQTAISTEVGGKYLRRSPPTETKKEKNEAVVEEKKEIPNIKPKGGKDLEQLQQEVKKEKKEVVDKNKTAVSTEVAGSEDLRQSQQGVTKNEKNEPVVDNKKETSNIKQKGRKDLEQPQQEVKQEKREIVVTVNKEVTRDKDLHQSQQEQTKKEKKESSVEDKEIPSVKLERNKDLEQSQQQNVRKEKREIVVTVNTEVTGGKDLHQSQQEQTKKEKKESSVEDKEIPSRKLERSKDLEQSQQEVGKEKEVIVTINTEAAGSKILHQSQQEQTKKDKVAQDKVRTAQEIKLSYQQTEIVVPQNIQENQIVSEKQDLPTSSIIEHYKTKNKQFISSNQTISTSQSQQTHKFISKKIEVNIKTSNIVQEQPAPLEEKNLVNITQTVPEKVNLKASTMKTVNQVRVLTLNDNEHQDSTLYRIEKNWTLQFRLGPSLLGRKVSLYCNYPESKDGKIMEFNRNRYFLLPWSADEGCQNADDTALFTQITVKVAGSFHFYFIYENATESGPQGSGFFLVDPVLKYGNNEELPLNCIQCQTVLSKCLGPFSTWESKLRVAKESGYNMIHFTPVQELGESNSAYSLSGQLKLNPSFNDNNTKTSFTDIEKLAAKIRTEWKVVSICDIVLNHTANETDWLEQHPESTYNCLNCPYMRPAYLLDAALHQFSVDVKNGFFDTWGIPPVVCTEEHLNAIRHALHTKILPEINLSELYICDVNKLVGEFLERARKAPPNIMDKNPDLKLKLIRDPLYQRLATRVDMDLALKIHNIYRPDSFDEESRLKRCGEQFKSNLDHLNKEITDEINLHLNAAVENSIAGMRYFRVQHDGPQIKDITIKDPLSPRYFTDYGKPKSFKEFEEVVYGPNSKYLMAHNGWVMNADPMRNFADPDSNVYLRRELIAWGDSVKLRFGDKPEDSPFLWNHMKAYVEQTAKIFDGVRLDNCHSTPIPVAEYLLDCARRVRPDLYVVAELFTNSDHTDNIFVNRLGISSLIREAMSAWDSHEEGRLVYRYGGDPVGAFFQPHFRPLVPSIAHALFLDLTHDNPSPVEKRSVFDLLPSAALVNMACCASGSNRGYDELVNHHIHVVDEERQYTEWTNDESLTSGNPRYVSYKSGIISAKRAINDLHCKLGIDGFSQVYVDQMDQDIVAVTRHRPETHQSVILIAFTAFGHPNLNAATYQRAIKPLRVEGLLDEIILEATLSHKSVEKGDSKYTHPENFTIDKKWINGLSEYHVDIKQHIQLVNSDVFELADSGNPNIIQLNFKNFKPGSVVAIKVSQPKNVQQSIHKLRDLMLSFSRNETTNLKDIIGRLNLADLNRALYRCDQEEQDEGKDIGAYNIPNFGSLVYCGFQGFMSLLSTIRPSNDLGHPMCGNLRDGNWMIDYIWKRLKLDEGTKELGQWIEKNTKPLEDIPRYLIPSYFDIIITGIYILLIEQAYNLMSDFVKNGSTFVKGLSLGSLQFAAVIKSADLAALSPNLTPPKPPTKPNDQGKCVQACVTLSAGLPHFSTGYMRNWGRDTFISLRGLFILTGRYQDARYHILGYAACLRHGLIPNLLDGGRNSRFNCRDAVWWWLYCIKSYVEEAPNGIEILSDKVSRIFPTDGSPALEPGVEDQALYEVIQEALKIHFQGLTFRERNAGRQIDAHMSDRGFNNQIGIHPETGFVFGGNEANCGTWMDKMGSSDKADNRGKPATPRDGCAVELVGLSKAVVTWLSELYQQKKYPYCGVERTSKSGTILKWTFKQWAEKIQNNFEQFFWVNRDPTDGEIRPDLINKRSIYKDSYGATQAWADFQLRCNFPIAMVTAPEMFNPKHAWLALQNAEKYLLGPLGMKTLDPEDWGYCGDYNNSDDSHSYKTAHGFNYHQGPEWVWPVGYFLRAKLQFAAANKELARTVATTKTILAKHFTELQTSAWRGLPELTNSNGSYCNDSSRTQAWSMACVLEVLHDLQKIESKQHTSVLN